MLRVAGRRRICRPYATLSACQRARPRSGPVWRLDGRLAEAVERGLAGVYAGGSWALDDYLPGRSDLDVAAVVEGPLAPAAAERVVSLARHEALPCPARALELVVYTSASADSGAPEPGFELNLNTVDGSVPPLDNVCREK